MKSWLSLALLCTSIAVAQEVTETPESQPSDAVIEKAEVPEKPAGQFVKTVTLGALDKVTARVTKLPMKVGETRKFGNLIIHVVKCWQADPEDTPDTKAFLEISETKTGQSAQHEIFKGWMFASNPSLKALEHPVYDVWVIQGVSASSSIDAPSAPSKASEDKVDEMLQQILQTPQE